MSAGPARRSLLDRAEGAGRAVETAALALILGAMIGLGGTQIFLRNVLGSGVPWADEALRMLLLWVAMTGAVAASREDRHISIDLLSRVLDGRARAAAGALVSAFTAAISAALAWYAFVFVAESREYGDEVLGGLPAWWFQAVLPLGFGLMAYRYLIWTLRKGAAALRGAAGDPS